MLGCGYRRAPYELRRRATRLLLLLARRRIAWSSKQQTCIAVRIEAIMFADCFGIGALHGFKSRKGTDQHKKGRAWQVKICQQDLRGLESIARRDEQGRLAGEWHERVVLACSGFQGAQTGGANRQDLVAALTHLVEACSRAVRNRCPLRMHAVLS